MLQQPLVDAGVGLSDPTLQAELDDRRICPRRACSLSAVLVDERGRALQPCTAVNIGERGVCLIAPACDAAVGQRFEVLFRVDTDAREWGALPVEGWSGMVVRTAPLDPSGRGDVSIAIYFDQPLFL